MPLMFFSRTNRPHRQEQPFASIENEMPFSNIGNIGQGMETEKLGKQNERVAVEEEKTGGVDSRFYLDLVTVTFTKLIATPPPLFILFFFRRTKQRFEIPHLEEQQGS